MYIRMKCEKVVTADSRRNESPPPEKQVTRSACSPNPREEGHCQRLQENPSLPLLCSPLLLHGLQAHTALPSATAREGLPTASRTGGCPAARPCPDSVCLETGSEAHAQSRRPAPAHFRGPRQVQAVPVLWPPSFGSEAPANPSSGSTDLLNGSQNSGKHLFMLISLLRDMMKVQMNGQ